VAPGNSAQGAPPGDRRSGAGSAPAGESEPPSPPDKPRHHRLRAITSWVSIVLACTLALVSVVVIYAHDELLDTDTFVATVGPLASNPEVQHAVADRVSTLLVEQTDVEQRVREALPAKADFLATPIADQVEHATDQIALKLMESTEFQGLWDAALRASHDQVEVLLTGSTKGAVSTNDGEVAVDLTKIETQVKERLSAKGITVFDNVPTANRPELVLFHSSELAMLQSLIKVLDKLAFVLPVVTLLLLAAGVALNADRRKGLIRAAGGLTLTMGLVLVLINVGVNAYLDTVHPPQSKGATTAVIDTVDAPLLDTVRTVLIVAALVTLAALLAGSSHIRHWVVNQQKPAWTTGGAAHDFVAAHRRGLEWGVLASGLLILLIWNEPTVLVAVIVLLVSFAMMGVVGVLGRSRDSLGSQRVESE
jgi:hypothetical protein